MTDRIKTTRISNYDGHKRLDKLLEKIAEGKLKPPREEVRDHYCPLCKYRKRSQRIVRSEILGSRVASLKPDAAVQFQGKFIAVCEDCAKELEAKKVG